MIENEKIDCIDSLIFGLNRTAIWRKKMAAQYPCDPRNSCVNGGRMDTMQVGMHGIVGQMQREEGAKKVRRGMAGVIREGRSAGGRAYGYQPILGKPGRLEIEKAEAGIITRIFTAYAAGASPRIIAAKINSEGGAPPRGLRWNASTINGNGKRGNGILRNPLYAGTQIWNRVRMVKDPATGRRVSRVNPETEWHTTAAPHLRIVDQRLLIRCRHARRQPVVTTLILRQDQNGSCPAYLNAAAAVVACRSLVQIAADRAFSAACSRNLVPAAMGLDTT
jgi:hypothetical protein